MACRVGAVRFAKQSTAACALGSPESPRGAPRVYPMSSFSAVLRAGCAGVPSPDRLSCAHPSNAHAGRSAAGPATRPAASLWGGGAGDLGRAVLVLPRSSPGLSVFLGIYDPARPQPEVWRAIAGHTPLLGGAAADLVSLGKLLFSQIDVGVRQRSSLRGCTKRTGFVAGASGIRSALALIPSVAGICTRLGRSDQRRPVRTFCLRPLGSAAFDRGWPQPLDHGFG